MGEMGELSGQVAIVTGGASGIGEATAELLAGEGAAVIVADQKKGQDGSPGRFVEHDVASEESWRKLLADVLSREGRLDIVVNNAGITGGMGTIESTTVENWQRVQAVDSEGVFLGCKYAIQGMKHTTKDKPAPKGSIVNVSSIAGVVGGAGPTAYSAAKGAVRLLSKSVALHCAEHKYDHPLQFRAPGRRRYADLQSLVADGRPRPGQGVPRLAPSGRPHGRAVGARPRHPVARLRPFVLRHRRRDRGRWRHHLRPQSEVAHCPALRTRSC